MSETSSQKPFAGLSRLKLFWALSRTPHGLIDMCTPAFGALLWLGYFPPLSVIIIGLITTFAGYTAVYALNDVIDYRTDKEKADMGGFADSGDYLDGVMVRHPMAQGLLSFKEGLFWSLAWAIVALIGAYILNPVCVLIFLGGCALETVYCLLWRVSPFRTIVSGGVKTTGAIAAVFAVDPAPSAFFLIFLFLVLFFWEIGGQNIPADWTDIEEDRRLNAQTIPVRFGVEWARIVVLIALLLALALSMGLFHNSQTRFNGAAIGAALLVGCYLLLLPAIKLFKTMDRAHAMALFNKASYYPLALFVVVLINLFI